MTTKSKNRSMNKAKKEKRDEFYTRLDFIELELNNYVHEFKDKIILLPCDTLDLFPDLEAEPEIKASKFWVYFHKNFAKLGIKKLVATHYNGDAHSYVYEYSGGDDENILSFKKSPLWENGDFRTQEVKDLIKNSDIVVTNPPFSLFREFIKLLIDMKKHFILVGHLNAFTNKGFIKLWMEKKVWLGYRDAKKSTEFTVPKYYEFEAMEHFYDENGLPFIKMGGIEWYTNLPVTKENPFIFTNYFYEGNEYFYPKYEGLDIINVDQLKYIPMDYKGLMGVPVSIFDKYNPLQIEILGRMHKAKDDNYTFGSPTIDGREKFARIVIRFR